MGNASAKAGLAEGEAFDEAIFSDHGAVPGAFGPLISSPFVQPQRQQQPAASLSSPLSPMAVTPTTSSDPPIMISPQVSPFQADEQGRQYCYQLQSNTLCMQPERKIAILIEWYHGGTDVFVEGSWDNWRTRTPLHRAGKDFTLVKCLPIGVYHYKFLVNGEWRHSPDLPHMYDENGNGINILYAQDFVPENLDGVAEFEAPSSPDTSYDSPILGPEDYNKDPPSLPSQLHVNNQLESYQYINSNPGSLHTSIQPQHVILNHLFVESRRATSNPVLAVGFTHRFRTKYVTVILHKPLQR